MVPLDDIEVDFRAVEPPIPASDGPDSNKITQISENAQIGRDPKDVNKTGNKRKLTEFGYLLQRKGFRLMRKYYKEKFEDFAASFDYKKRIKVITPNEINAVVMKFIEVEFKMFLSILDSHEISLLREAMLKVVLSDRSKKKEPMTKGLDFAVVRNLFGKYTQKNMKIFMQDPANSFLYTHFYLIHGRNACFEQNDVDCANFNEQMKKLMLEAFKSLFPRVKPVYQTLYDNNAMKL